MKKTGEGQNEYNQNTRNKDRRWLAVVMTVLCDAAAVWAAFFLALLTRFDFQYSSIPQHFLTPYRRFIPIMIPVAILIFWLFRLYKSMLRYVSVTELVRVLEASLVAGVVHAVGITLLYGRMPLSYYLGGLLLQTALLVTIRFAYRLFDYSRKSLKRNSETINRVMLIGAGNAGQMLLKDMNLSPNPENKVVCIIDDNLNKQGRYLEGVPIVGGRDDILKNVEKYHVNKIFLAIPSASAEDKRDILNICGETNCELKQLPGLYQLVSGQVTVSAMKDVSVEDLLGRTPIRADLDEVFRFINGKTVLVTGGGGSIGSELCRQIAAHSPKQLIIFDIYENNAYDIQMELRERYPNLNLTVLIGSVRDSRRILKVFETYKPEIVYHAAAHKHVPLMEDSPCEAIKNNALGTYKTAYAAMANGCKRFVLISTDKAVNPTNVMGASKRLCEMIIQCFDRKIKAGKADEIPYLSSHEEHGETDGIERITGNPKTEFVAVRFGNVLGSNGSVIPLFKKQIARGGPVTVTHPDIIRYFMTIPEAVSLVLLAGTYAKGGEIFVLDMGSPVKIDTLARNLIKLAGFKPDEDIKIEYTGLRPGEKLYEEKLMAEEGLEKTENALIHIGHAIPFDTDTFIQSLEVLMTAAYSNDDRIRDKLLKVVSTYHPENGAVESGTTEITTDNTQQGEDHAIVLNRSAI
ncbi:MAG: polysaccharide biosynthesis protein [Clostridia bacterium]|nr:polysaccharide biosynthesis protein [Clostridia bacterium]